MATRKSTTQPVKLTAAEAREKVEELQHKLDNYDKEIDERIEVALKHHIREYHQKGE